MPAARQGALAKTGGHVQVAAPASMTSCPRIDRCKLTAQPCADVAPAQDFRVVCCACTDRYCHSCRLPCTAGTACHTVPAQIAAMTCYRACPTPAATPAVTAAALTAPSSEESEPASGSAGMLPGCRPAWLPPPGPGCQAASSLAWDRADLTAALRPSRPRGGCSAAASRAALGSTSWDRELRRSLIPMPPAGRVPAITHGYSAVAFQGQAAAKFADPHAICR